MGSRCSHCDVIVSVPPGGSAPTHQEKGKRNTCPGSGRTTNPI